MGEQNRRIKSHSTKLTDKLRSRLGFGAHVDCRWIQPHHTLELTAYYRSPRNTVMEFTISHLLVDSYRSKRDVITEIVKEFDIRILLGE